MSDPTNHPKAPHLDPKREGPKRERTSKLQGDPSLDLLAIRQGARVALVGGATAEVVDNPRDGMWILLKFIEVPEQPELEGTEELVFWADLVGEVTG